MLDAVPIQRHISLIFSIFFFTQDNNNRKSHAWELPIVAKTSDEHLNTCNFVYSFKYTTTCRQEIIENRDVLQTMHVKKLYLRPEHIVQWLLP